jgi:hypothetical protein
MEKIKVGHTKKRRRRKTKKKFRKIEQAWPKCVSHKHSTKLF